MVRRYHQLNGHELTAEDEMVSITNLMDMNLNKLWVIFEGQGSLVCCSPWGGKESDTT